MENIYYLNECTKKKYFIYYKDEKIIFITSTKVYYKNKSIL